MEILYIIIGIIIVLLIIIIIINNNVVTRENNINNSFSSLDVYLKKRYDLIPNLVECVKGYMKHEQETLEKLVKLRSTLSNNNLINENNDIENELSNFFLKAENYPELKSSSNFSELQNEMSNIEDEIAAARRTYNAHINSYNIYINKFPTNIICSLLGYKKKDLFKIDEKESKNKKWIKENEN